MIIKNVSNKYATRERVANLVTLFQMQDWEVYVRLVNGLWWTQGFEYNDNNEIVAYDFENLNDFGGFDLNPCESGFFHHSTSNRFVYHISARGVGGFDLNPCESGFFHHSTSNRFVYHISARGVINQETPF